MNLLLEKIFDNYYLASVLILLSQVSFIYVRTLNVIYTSEKKILPAILTGNLLGILTLFTFSVTLKSITDGNILAVFMFLIGGTIGTYYGIKSKDINEKIYKMILKFKLIFKRGK
jgi:hypothetical protein